MASRRTYEMITAKALGRLSEHDTDVKLFDHLHGALLRAHADLYPLDTTFPDANPEDNRISIMARQNETGAFISEKFRSFLDDQKVVDGETVTGVILNTTTTHLSLENDEIVVRQGFKGQDRDDEGFPISGSFSLSEMQMLTGESRAEELHRIAAAIAIRLF